MVKTMSFEDKLKFQLQDLTDSRVKDSISYSLLAGGKRIRPMLLYEVVKGYGIEETVADEFACALEMIHTYSLIHDDLPSMDNDDLRRGIPTNHKQFDEATAILAGDGLLTYAFETATRSKLSAEQIVKAVKVLALMAGPNGMVLGQCLDMKEDSNTNWEDIKRIHKYKTGCLLSAPLMIGAIIANQNDDVILEWQKIGNMIGLAFQIQDDLLDVTVSTEILGKTNSDVRNEKVTSISLLGIEQTSNLMKQLYEDSCSLICNMKGFDSTALIHFIQKINQRTK